MFPTRIIKTFSRSGEIGIRTRLKIWREQSHVGSIPTSGTSLINLAILEKKASNLREVYGIILSTGGDIMIHNFTEVIKN